MFLGGIFPPNSLRYIVYVTVVISVTIIVFIIYNSRYRKHAMTLVAEQAIY